MRLISIGVFFLMCMFAVKTQAQLQSFNVSTRPGGESQIVFNEATPQGKVRHTISFRCTEGNLWTTKIKKKGELSLVTIYCDSLWQKDPNRKLDSLGKRLTPYDYWNSYGYFKYNTTLKTWYTQKNPESPWWPGSLESKFWAKILQVQKKVQKAHAGASSIFPQGVASASYQGAGTDISFVPLSEREKYAQLEGTGVWSLTNQNNPAQKKVRDYKPKENKSKPGFGAHGKPRF
jgi:hypothetical protein